MSLTDRVSRELANALVRATSHESCRKRRNVAMRRALATCIAGVAAGDSDDLTIDDADVIAAAVHGAVDSAIRQIRERRSGT